MKKIVKTGAVLGAATLGIGEIVYEGALNTAISNKIADYFSKKDTVRISQNCTEYSDDAGRWFDENKGEDNVIFSEKAGNAHAYIILNDTPSNKWAILNHGYNSGPGGTSVYAMEYNKLGYNCVCPSMRGFGNDENRYCSMGYHDKDISLAWINYIAQMYPESQIVVHGYSMGAATTMLAVGEELPENVKCAVADCGYTNCYEQYAYVLKQKTGLPAFPLLDLASAVSQLRGNFKFKDSSPIDALKNVKIPMLFVHGSEDDFVPFFMMDKLYDACPTEKEKFAVEGAVHACSAYYNPELYWKNVKSFTDKYIK